MTIIEAEEEMTTVPPVEKETVPPTKKRRSPKAKTTEKKTPESAPIRKRKKVDKKEDPSSSSQPQEKEKKTKKNKKEKKETVPSSSDKIDSPVKEKKKRARKTKEEAHETTNASKPKSEEESLPENVPDQPENIDSTIKTKKTVDDKQARAESKNARCTAVLTDLQNYANADFPDEDTLICFRTTQVSKLKSILESLSNLIPVCILRCRSNSIVDIVHCVENVATKDNEVIVRLALKFEQYYCSLGEWSFGVRFCRLIEALSNPSARSSYSLATLYVPKADSEFLYVRLSSSENRAVLETKIQISHRASLEQIDISGDLSLCQNFDMLKPYIQCVCRHRVMADVSKSIPESEYNNIEAFISENEICFMAGSERVSKKNKYGKDGKLYIDCVVNPESNCKTTSMVVPVKHFKVAAKAAETLSTTVYIGMTDWLTVYMEIAEIGKLWFMIKPVTFVDPAYAT